MKKYGPLSSGAVGTTCVDTDSDSTSSHPIKGMVVGVYLDLDGISCASAPTITIKTVSDPPITILAVTTDVGGWYHPVTPLHDPETGAVISTLKSAGIPIADYVIVALTDAEEGDYVNVWLLLED